MSSSMLPADRDAFHQLCETIEPEMQRQQWGEVSHQLKEWARTVRGTFTELSDRQRITELGIALLIQGELSDSRGLVPVFQLGGSEAIVALHMLLLDRDASFESRWFAGQTLAKLKRVEAMTLLVETLDSDDEMTASLAIDTLNHFGEPEVDLLVSELKRIPAKPENPTQRRSLVRALTQVRDAVVIDPLLGMVHDPDPTIRQMVIGALSACDDDRVFPVLLAALRDTTATIRKTALTSLGAKAQYQRQYLQRNPATAQTLPTINWLDHFQPLTLDINLDVAIQAVIAIGRLDSAPANDVLLSLLRSPLTPQPQAIATVRALLQTPDAATIQALLAACPAGHDPHAFGDGSIAIEVMRGLGRLREPNLKAAVAVLVVEWCDQHLQSIKSKGHDEASHDPDLLQTIAYSLGNLGDPIGRSWLEHWAQDSRDRVRVTAIKAIEKLPAF